MRSGCSVWYCPSITRAKQSDEASQIFFQGSGIGAGVYAYFQFFWQFRLFRTPSDIRSQGEALLGGGTEARDAANYIHASFSVLTLLLLFGFAIALIGSLPTWMGAILSLGIGLLFFSLVAAIAGWSIPVITLDRAPLTPTVESSECSFVPGTLDQCTSTSRSVAVNLSNSPAGGKNCFFDLSIDWGDGQPAEKLMYEGDETVRPTIAEHEYDSAGEYEITVTGVMTGRFSDEACAYLEPDDLFRFTAT